MIDYLPRAEHLSAEFAARDALRRLGFTVEPEAGSVRVSGPGFTLRVRAACLAAAHSGGCLKLGRPASGNRPLPFARIADIRHQGVDRVPGGGA